MKRPTGDGRRETGDNSLPVIDVLQDGMERRDVVKMLTAASLAAIGLAAPDVARAAEYARDALQQGAPAYRPIFFTAAEWPMVRTLSDLVIPKDARSGSATDAGVPEFMDFIMNEYKGGQVWMRDGLKWLNAECKTRFKKDWVQCSPSQQHAILDDIAFPKKAKPSVKAGVDFFSHFRDLTSSGFWTSRIGVKDIGYMGNITVSEWVGCPEPQLSKLGVSYKMSMHAARRG
jgi:gluconate 2-dehydrogenase gamma chain